ncbi:MAG: phosphatase PAP2 family protein [Verrucomicrobiales bacterium]|jgi:lipid A 4'-phosphatase|nr:phosphatase PAP2 family protein [Verrucomicrobiales bacterium]MDP4793008.1 phosphatase PAP2 family protein [Verrucomicrobiales bacterium]MDP5004391.1 phosphatase PAP2 family protein [Verrucomicrobiales bacterium]
MTVDIQPGASRSSLIRARCREWFGAFIVDLKSPPAGPRFRLGAMVLGPLALGLALTFWARFSGFDLGAQKHLYHLGGDEWTLGEIPFWKYLYKWGTIPAAVAAFTALTLYCLSWSLERFRLWRKVFLFIVLTAVIGPGVITNGLLKEYWGRPRPREVIGLGGRSAFEPVLTIDPSSAGLSFPCGHATMGFIFMGGYFILRRHRAGLARGFLLGGMTLGSLMGVARMVQGGHFFTDAVWAGLICYFVPMGLYYAMGLDRSLLLEKVDPAKRMPLQGKIALFSAGTAMLAAVMIATPYQERRDYTLFRAFMQSGPLDLILHFAVGVVDVVPAETFRLRAKSFGHGVPTSGITASYQESESEGGARFVYSERISGWFSEVNSETIVEIPWERIRALRLKTAGATKISLAPVTGRPVIELAGGEGEVVLETAGQAVRLVSGDPSRVEGVEDLEPGKGEDGFYLLELASEFTGRVRIVSRKGE